jgi:hypothetical protein
MIIFYNSNELAELFDVDINNDTLILGTFAPWEIYNTEGHMVLDFGDGNTMEFDVKENRREQLENSGWMIYYDIRWDE